MSLLIIAITALIIIVIASYEIVNGKFGVDDFPLLVIWFAAFTVLASIGMHVLLTLCRL